MSFEFIYSGLIKLVFLATVCYLCYRLFKRGNHKWSVGLGVIASILVFVYPPFVREYDNFSNIESVERYEVQLNTTLPARVSVESEPSFEERVKKDLEEYQQNRETNVEETNHDKND